MRRFPSGTVDQYIYFVAVDSSDLKTRETGLSTFTVYRARNGAAAAAYTTPTIAEVSSANMPGVYSLLLDEDMTIASGNKSEETVLHITQASMAPVTLVYELYRPDVTDGETITVSSGAISTVTTTTTATNVTTVNGLAAGVITATSIAADAITDAKVASDVTIASVTGAVGSVTGAVGSVTGNVGGNVTGSVGSVASGGITATSIAADAIGASELAADAVTEIAAGVWDRLTSTLTTVGSAGKLVVDNLNATVSSRATQTSLDTVDDLLDTEIAAIKTVVDAILVDTDVIGAAGAGLTALATQASVNTIDDFLDTEIAAIKAKTDLIPAAPSAVGDIPTAAAVADAVWDEVLSGHLTAGSTGNALNSAGSAGDPWGTALPGAYGAGSAGYIVGTNLDATVSTRATAAALTVVDDFLDTEVAAILAAVDTEVATIVTQTTAANIRAAVGLASANLDTQIGDIPTNAELATSQAAADDATLAAIAALSIPTAAAIADAVWDEDATAHQTQGTFGQAIGDPVADTNSLYKAVVTDATGATVGVDVVALKAETVTILADTNDIQARLPAALVSGRMDVSVGAMAANVMTAAAAAADLTTELQSGLATAAALTTVAGYIDTEVASILAAVDTEIGTLQTTLNTVAGYVDTEVAAIKAKTDLIPAAPAAVGDVPTAAQNAAGLLDLAAGVETGLTLRQTLRLMAAVMVGKVSGAGTGTEVFRDVNDTKARVTATVDLDGNRTAITRDAT
jgi:hypothetical protein